VYHFGYTIKSNHPFYYWETPHQRDWYAEQPNLLIWLKFAELLDENLSESNCKRNIGIHQHPFSRPTEIVSKALCILYNLSTLVLSQIDHIRYNNNKIMTTKDEIGNWNYTARNTHFIFICSHSFEVMLKISIIYIVIGVRFY